MKRHTWIVVLATGVLIGVALGYLAGRRSAKTESPARLESGRIAADGGTDGSERRILYWHDPMVPGTRFDRPGKSPFMDMDLVPVYEDADSDAGTVRVPAGVSQSLGLRTGVAERSTPPAELEAVGSVAYDESLTEVVQVRVDGYVERLHVRAPLERVRRGQPLVDVVAPEWIAAQEEYLALLDASSSGGQAIRDAARRRLGVLGVPEAAIREIARQRRTNDAIRLYAPIDGVVTELAVRDGSAFAAGGLLLRINGLERVWIVAQVPEAEIARIPPEGSISATTAARPGESFVGRSYAVLPDLDPRTRTLPVRVLTDNSAGRLSPGMLATLRFEAPPSEMRLSVPSEAVITTGERSVVILARDDGGFDVAEVTPGAEANGRTTILAGLEEGQRIVLSGQFLIDSEASLRSALNRLSDVTPAAEHAP